MARSGQKPLVLVIASRKGGVGKSTLCLNLAITAEADGYGPVVLYDTDPQKSVTRWYEERQEDRPIVMPGGAAELDGAIERAGAAGVRLMIVDTPPSIAAATDDVLRRADYVLIPTQDGRPDLRAAADTVDLIERLGKPFAFALTFIRGSIQAAEAAKVLSARGAIGAMIGNRVSVKAAWNGASAVVETEPRGKAAAEFQELWSFVAKRMNFAPDKKTDTRKEAAHV